jgi:hypothetical protein
VRVLVRVVARDHELVGTGESPVTAIRIVVAHQGVSIGGTSGLRVELPLAS